MSLAAPRKTITVFYDGWVLAYEPNSPAALHLWGMLVSCPPGFQPVVVLPAGAPGWLPASVQALSVPAKNTPLGRLKWEQVVLPGLARQGGARLLHLVSSASPFLNQGLPVIVTPAEFASEPAGERLTLTERMRLSLGQGGLVRARAVLLPEDMLSSSGKFFTPVKPFVPPGFAGQPGVSPGPSSLDFSEPFVIYHGPGDLASLQRLFSAWSWVSRPLGDQVSLVLIGLSHLPERRIPELMLKYELAGNVLTEPGLSPAEIAGLYRDCTALFHPGRLAPWGEPLRSALAGGKPVVAAQTAPTEALVGTAAYLAAWEDSRSLGAALISVLVDTVLAEQLAHAALERSASWRVNSPAQILEPVYLRASSVA